MLKNLKIGYKTLLAFGSIIFMAVGIIIWLLTGINDTAQGTQLLYEQPYTASNYLWVVRRNLVDTQRVLYRLMSESDSTVAAAVEPAALSLGENQTSMDAAIKNFSAILSAADVDMITHLDSISQAVGEGNAVVEQVLALMRQGNRQQAKELVDTNYMPIFERCNAAALELFEIMEADAANFVSSAGAASDRALVIGIILLVGSAIAAVLISARFANSLLRPIRQLESAAKEMTRGNLKAVDVITYQSQDELGELADSLRFTMTTLSAYVDEISSTLVRLSHGDLTVESDHLTDFLGDFSEIKRSFVTILKSFNHTLGGINLASQQVDNSASQVSSASQLLSNGATEQAAAIEELTATVAEISNQIRANAANAQSANELTDQVDLEVKESTNQMHQMNGAMEEISRASNEIGKILKTIEDIAFQTNILALNAAVEAARAGAAGKGFAVVADEVRNLASKSAEASKNTADLIETSVRAVENGASIVTATAKSLETVAQTTQQVVATVTDIAEASALQAASVEQVSVRVDEISNVVQQNSATAEQSAAASEELSGQADILNQQVAHFQLYKAQQTHQEMGNSVFAR